MKIILRLRPERTTPRGRLRGADYLHHFNYPPLLSDQRVTVTSTGSPADAAVYTSQDGVDAAVALLESLGYQPEGLEVRDA
jgi:hypothetical protein